MRNIHLIPAEKCQWRGPLGGTSRRYDNIKMNLKIKRQEGISSIYLAQYRDERRACLCGDEP
jgi:hypothetical protein